jgi:hypothetical protein
MRFISLYGRFMIQYQGMRQEAYANGMVRELQPQINLTFEPYRLTPDERELALNTWTFNGTLQEQDEVTTVAPDYRIGLFDSRQAQEDHLWPDELREKIEQYLFDYSERYDWVLAVRSHIAPPWPRYDDFRGTPNALIRRLVEDGHELEKVLTYEREHQNRPKIVEELEKAIEHGAVELVEDEVLG